VAQRASPESARTLRFHSIPSGRAEAGRESGNCRKITGEAERVVADISVERKKTPIWPFLVAAVVLGLLIWGLIGLFDRDEQTRIDTPAAATDTGAAGSF
jgi:hypothetical protein